MGSEPAPVSVITSEILGRWCANVRPFPLPDYITPTGGVPLCDVDDETLMNAPPHLIAHIQTTAAQGGLQVISPRQTPFSCLMTRTLGGRRELGDHVVGSTAVPNARWPTLEDDDIDFLLPDEPLPTQSSEHALRQKTKTEPITKAGRLLADPILNCLVKGRAVIDVLRREDVAGGAEEMTSLLADAWGVERDEIDDLDAFTLGIQGPLLRHAIKVDDVYPMVHAPIHLKRVVVMGASEVTRDLLPDDSAMDWRRMRVFCEAVFMLSCAVEGLPVRYMRVFPSPGDPSARTDRDGIMVFTPAPATAWTYEASTFSIYPSLGTGRMRSAGIPREVMEALARYTSIVRPVSYAMAAGHRAVTRRTTVTEAALPDRETLSEAYRLMARSVSVSAARGRTAAATVRNMIYDAIAAADFPIRLRLVRYLTLTRDECRAHLDLREVPDCLIDRVANKFLEVGELVRMRVVAEAARRGATAEQWWADILAQAPDSYRSMVEGTKGWAKVAMWLIFKSPTDRWTKLVHAVNYGAMRDAARGVVSALTLPAEKGSKERLLAAARAGVKSITKCYAGYYMGVADVGLALSDTAAEMGRERTAALLREAAYLWVLRARCLRGTNVNPLAHEDETPSINHLRIRANPIDILIAPAPYRAFDAYIKAAMDSPVIPPIIKNHLSGYDPTRKSDAFKSLDRPIAPMRKSVLSTFMLEPALLGHKMEKAWGELASDIREIAKIYGADEVVKKVPLIEDPNYISQASGTVFRIERNVGPQFDFYGILADLEGDEVDWMEETLEALTEVEQESILTRKFHGVAHLREVMEASRDATVSANPKTSELVK